MLYSSGCQALVNVRGNYNRVKVSSAALIKSGYMLERLEYLVLLRYTYPYEVCQVKMYPVQTISRKDKITM